MRDLAAEATRLRGIDLEAKARTVEAMAADVEGWRELDATAMTVRVRGLLPQAPASGVRLSGVTDNDSRVADTFAAFARVR